MPFRFQEELVVRFEPQKQDLQLWIGPRALNKQGSRLFIIHMRISFLRKQGGSAKPEIHNFSNNFV